MHFIHMFQPLAYDRERNGVEIITMEDKPNPRFSANDNFTNSMKMVITRQILTIEHTPYEVSAFRT